MSASLCDEVPYAKDTTVIISTVLEPGHEVASEYRWAVAQLLGGSGVDLGGDSTSPLAHRFVREIPGPASEASHAPTTDESPPAVRHLRERSGLTWEQLARVLGVQRRSLHNWAGGAPISPSNRERLQRLVALVDFVDRGFVDQTNRALLSPTPDGHIVLDWLAAGRDDEVKRLLGQGRGPQPGGSHLSSEERERRRPPHPVTLMDAIHDVQPVSVGQRRVVRKLRGPA